MNIDFDSLARLIKLTETAQIHSLEIQDGTQTIKLTKYPSDTPVPPLDKPLLCQQLAQPPPEPPF